MYYVYVLYSVVNNRMYIGYSTDVRVRVEQHNAGRVRSTKGYRPWSLIYYEAYFEKSDATKRERQLKNHAAKEQLRTQLQQSFLNVRRDTRAV